MLIVLMCCMTYFNTAIPFIHGHVQAHQDQLLGVGELLHAVHCIYFVSSYWSFWCAAWSTLTLLYTPWPCLRPPRSSCWTWTTYSCWQPSNVLTWCLWRTTHAFKITSVLKNLITASHSLKKLVASECPNKKKKKKKKNNNNNNKAIPRTAISSG